MCRVFTCVVIAAATLLSGIEDSQQEARADALWSTIVSTMLANQQYYLATEACISLLIRMAKHYEAVRSWMFAVRELYDGVP